MVRFARADGSKGSNKRIMEDATPWSEIVAQMQRKQSPEEITKPKKKDLGKKRKLDEVLPTTLGDNCKTPSDIGQETKAPSTESTVKSEKISLVKIKKIKKVNSGESGEEKSPTKKKKTKKGKTETEEDQEPDSREDQEPNSEEDQEPDSREDQEPNSEGNQEPTSPKKKKKKGHIKRLIPDNVTVVVEDGIKYQVLPNGKKRPWFDLPYQESDRMTRYEGFWIKPSMVKELDELKATLKLTMDESSVKKQMMKAKRKARWNLIRDLVYEQKDEFMKNKEEGKDDDKSINNNVENAKDSRDKKKENKTKNYVSRNIPERFKDFKKHEDEEIETELFDGFPVTKEGAERLKQIRADLLQQKLPKAVLRKTLKMERRREEKKLAREKKRVCLNCRKRGHTAKECSESGDGNHGSESNSICYACGSTEHRLKDCSKSKNTKGLPHATCFICRKVGHISKQCPDNPRGLFPNGGSCRGCGSVEHLAANCPKLTTEKEKHTMKIGRIVGSALESLDFEPEFMKPKPKPVVFRQNVNQVRPKIIKFD